MGRDDDLKRWTTAGLISDEQRAAILEHERARETQATSNAPALVEVLIYLGAAAVVGAMVAALSDVWEDLALGGRVALLAALSATAGIAGSMLRDDDSPAIARASSVLWLISVGFLGFAFLAIGADIEGDDNAAALLLVGGPSLALASWYQAKAPRAPQVLALFISANLFTMGIADVAVELTETIAGFTIAGTCALLGALVRAAILRPTGFAFGLGAIGVLGGVWIAGFPDGGEWAEALAILLAAGALALSVSLRSTSLLVVGAMAFFLFVTTSVMRHFADTIGVPVALLIVGALLIGSAILVARLRPLTRRAS